MRKINRKYNIYIFSYKKIKLIFTLKTFSVALWRFVGKNGLWFVLYIATQTCI